MDQIASAEAAHRQPRRATVAGLDALRLLAALLVVGYHFLYFSWIEPVAAIGIHAAVGRTVAFPEAVAASWWGWVGVQIFFVISGFVITLSSANRTAFQFAVGRLSRLFPAVLLFSTLALAVILSNHMLPPGEALQRWLRTVLLFPQGPWIDGVVWTLTVELVFYAVIGLIIQFGLRVQLPMLMRAAAIGLAGFWLMVFLAGAGIDLGDIGYGAHWLAHRYVSRPLLLATGCYFLVGMFAYEIHTRGWTAERGGFLALSVAGSVAAIYDFACELPAVVDDGYSPLVPVGVWLVACGLGAAALVVEHSAPAGERTRKVVRYLGLLTFPLYLVHNITGGWLLGRFYATGLDRWPAVCAALLACILVSHVFVIAVEPRLVRLLGLAKLTARARREPERIQPASLPAGRTAPRRPG